MRSRLRGVSESVWDYPRPPALDPSSAHVVVEHAGVAIAETSRSIRVLETSHPPTYYLPVEDFLAGVLVAARSGRRSTCEFKGHADYYDLLVPTDRGLVRVPAAAWGYARPWAGFEPLVGHVAVYPELVDRCQVDGETVRAQEGSFYGGWITSGVTGPFKGAPGTMRW